MSVNKTSPGIRKMFSEISGRYDLMNSIMTFGRDQAWRRRLLREIHSPSHKRMLDLGTGTGKIALEARRRYPSLRIVAADFTLDMMMIGKASPYSSEIMWCAANAFQLPFPDGAFDAVTSGYLIRNVSDVPGLFREQLRVLRPGGRIACLDTSPLDDSLLSPLILAYFRWVIPLLGSIITRNRAAYEYLPESTRKFRKPEDISRIIKDSGFKCISYRYFMFRTMSLITGIKPE